MFPELVGRVCIKAAICCYHGCRLAERTFTPYAIVTSDNLDEYYQRNEKDGAWELKPVRARHLLNTTPSVALIDQCHHQHFPARIGYVKIFSSHEWYQNMEQAMQAQAEECGIIFEVVDASQDWEREIDAIKRAIGYAAARYVSNGNDLHGCRQHHWLHGQSAPRPARHWRHH